MIMFHRFTETLLNCFIIFLFRENLCYTFISHSVNATAEECNENDFECDNGNCILNMWVCDEDNDCRDHSDEVDCPDSIRVCSLAEFECDSGACIPLKWQCDQDRDCENGSDEDGCSVCPSHTFSCADLLICIPTSWKCDGAQDCRDGSDEIDCQVSTFVCSDGTEIDAGLRCDATTDCPNGEDEEACADCPGSLCDNNQCIPSSRYCDGVPDCKYGEDEPPSCNPDCMVENGGCQHICIQNEDSVTCACAEGFDVYNSTHCEDRDECKENLNICPGHPMRCVNEPGSFKCICPPGFFFDSYQMTCYSNDSFSPPIIFSSLDDITYLIRIELNETMCMTAAHQFYNIVAIDFDPQEGTFFFSEVGSQRIIKYLPTSQTQPIVIADEGVEIVDGVAYDWIYRNLYFTETRRNKIEVICINTHQRKVLFDTDLDQPRGIAVDPLDGYLYFTDWGVDPKIEKAAMDGSTRGIIIHENLHWPNGLCIEYTLRRLYWVNAASSYEDSYIASSDLDGGRIQILIEGPYRVKQPFSITVLQDRIYWTDWGMKSVVTANSFTGSDWSVVLHDIPSPRDIRVFNRKAKHSAVSLCPTGTYACSHMCLSSPNYNGFSCSCPGNNTLADDDRTCLCNSTAVLGKNGISCGNDRSIQPTAEPIDEESLMPEGGLLSKFDLQMTCHIFKGRIICQTTETREIVGIPREAPTSITCKLFKASGELICTY